MPVYYDRTKTNWWLSVGGSPVGDVHRSLTNKLLHDRWLTCQVLENARVFAMVNEDRWFPVEVRIMKDGEPQSGDII